MPKSETKCQVTDLLGDRVHVACCTGIFETNKTFDRPRSNRWNVFPFSQSLFIA